LANIKTSKKHIQEKPVSYRKAGKIFLRKYLLEKVLGKKYTHSSADIIPGTIEIYISLKHKRIEIKCELTEKDTLNLKELLKHHPSFTDNPDKETVTSALCAFDFDALTCENTYNFMTRDLTAPDNLVTVDEKN
jgi:hypothetical protein